MTCTVRYKDGGSRTIENCVECEPVGACFRIEYLVDGVALVEYLPLNSGEIRSITVAGLRE